MKTLFNGLLIILFAVGMASCEKVKGKGDIISQTRTVSGFNKINLSIDATVYFTSDTVYYLEVKAQQNILDILETTVNSNDEMLIRYKKGVVVGKHEPIEIFMAAPGINGFGISGSGSIFINNELTGDYIDMGISGSGDIHLVQLAAGELNATISGSGSIYVTEGTLNEEDLKISGSGVIDVAGVECATVYIDISGSGNIYTWATQLMDVTISGSGNVYYKGSPVINTHISGSGSLIPLQ